VPPPKSIRALAFSPGTKLLALARYRAVDIVDADTKKVVRSLNGLRGAVNSVLFSADGKSLFTASGENVIAGEAKQWNVADGSLVRTFDGHKDILYSMALSPDGTILATGSYDHKIKLWEIASGKEIKTLHGHNGAVFGLAFRPDGQILASASGDRTVKLWNVAKGERVDTLSQPTKDVNCVAFSIDGKRLYAGGLDSRIRVWQISEAALETTNPILESKYAHEGAVLRLDFSPDGKWLWSCADDRTVKLWDAATMRERVLLEPQPDWVSGLCFVNGQIVVGRFDGSLAVYDVRGKLISTNLTTAARAGGPTF
jgi:WD40 repeat protein